MQLTKGTSSVGFPPHVFYMGVGKICDFHPKLPFISETVRDRPMVAMGH